MHDSKIELAVRKMFPKITEWSYLGWTRAGKVKGIYSVRYSIPLRHMDLLKFFIYNRHREALVGQATADKWPQVARCASDIRMYSR